MKVTGLAWWCLIGGVCLLGSACKEKTTGENVPVEPPPVIQEPPPPLPGPEEPEEEGYVLASGGMKLPVGSVGERSVRITMLNAAVKRTEAGSNQVGKITTRSNKEFSFKVTGEDEVEVTCKRDRTIREERMGTSVEADPQVGKLEGKVVMVRRRDGEWEGQLATGSDATWNEDGEIQQLIDWLKGAEARAMFGEEPREIGEEWDVDPGTVPGLDSGVSFTGNYRLKFTKIGDFNGIPCAVLEGRIDIAGRSDLGLGSIIEQKFRGSVAIYRSLDYQVDLSTVITGEMTYVGGNSAEGVSTTVRGNLTINRRISLTLPKVGE